MSSRAVVVCNGEPPPLALLQRLWKQAQLRVCADGGANFLLAQGLLPDAIVGDMDSLAPEVMKRLSLERLIHVTEQNTNDADKAVRYCLQHRMREVHLLGAAGGRSDQFLANLEVLYKYAGQATLVLWTAQERLQVITQRWHEILTPGVRLSLLPLFGPAYGVTTSGLAYALQDATLQMGQEPCGLSNEVTQTSVSVQVRQGQLLLVLQTAQET